MYRLAKVFVGATSAIRAPPTATTKPNMTRGRLRLIVESVRHLTDCR